MYPKMYSEQSYVWDCVDNEDWRERERERMKRAMIELLRWNACGAFLVVVLSNYSNANYWLLETAINIYDNISSCYAGVLRKNNIVCA